MQISSIWPFEIREEGGVVGGRARRYNQCQMILGLECQAKIREIYEICMILLKMKK